MTAIFTKEAANALKSHKAKENLGCESLTQQIHTLQTELLRLSRETVDAFDNDLDVESSDLPIYDRQSTISQLDRAATELALTQGRVDVHSDIFDKVVNQVTEASEKWVAWEKTNKEKENQSPDHTPDDDEQEGDGVKDANENAPKVPDITKLYATTLAKSLPEPTTKSRALMLKKSRDLRKHKETLLWMLMPEIDLGDSDKWWISLGSLVSKHVGREGLAPEPNGYGLSEDDSDDELFVSRKSNLKCPITRDYLENPVRAIVCKHLFSGEAFKQWLQQTQGRNQCPVAGCNNHLRRMADVEADEDVVRRVKRLKRNVEKKHKERETLGTQRI
ncbi:hypothetical protein B0I71DRAFT_137116 [Yarrowia lipolytica]|uniref:SP-RING-type domain-containing protein n=1 Tax=Yarrowia lipolytica TaxID=4952 RepID=A0A371BXC4_YARLL|nr:hypothetical protein B0I71DRAFT_137116 [Yarrowia lipolytica]